MYFLAFIILAIISGLFLFKLLNKRLKRFQSKYLAIKDKHAILLKEYQNFDEINARLNEDVQKLVESYEITKELTRYRTFDDVFSVFRECLVKDIALEDCQFIKPGVDTSKFSGYDLIPLKIDNELIGNLAINGLSIEDKDKFYILFNQLFLVLKRVRLYAKIEELAITDSLTNVYLRRYFQERLEGEINRCKNFNLGLVFLMLDLDNFKSYNDRYGHLVGDVLLSTVAKIIKDNLREIDVVARYGGEEFSIILPNTNRQEAEYVSQRLRQAIAKEHIRAYDEDLRITVSIGGSRFPQDAKQSQQLIDKADRALYNAKQAGKNRVCFWS
ncbi:MAG: GGDEF domain-containing protein [Candidatus Omnitrophota bacterium]|jgi:diguanylate cyclase (GGDEF)-like protein